MKKKPIKGSHLDQRTPVKNKSPIPGKSKGLSTALSKVRASPKSLKSVKVKFK